MMQSIKSMQEMMETFEMMKELFPEGMGSGTGGNMGVNLAEVMSGLSGMGGMADLFSMFQSAQPPA